MDPATLEHCIVTEIRRAREISRRELADCIGITNSTAGRRIDTMIARGIVVETRIQKRQEAGRPRRMLELASSYGSFLGFDFDSRRLYGVLTDFSQTVLTMKRVLLPENPTRQIVLSHIRELISELQLTAPSLPILGVGIGVPGHVERATGQALWNSQIKDWENVNLPLELDLPLEIVHLENNTRVTAIGEYWQGRHTAINPLVCLNIRTGLGAAIVLDGKILDGRHEKSGEICGWKVSPGSAETDQDDSLENVATARSIIPDGPQAQAEWTQFVAECKEGDVSAIHQLDRVVRHHSDALRRIVQLIDPEAIFVAGMFLELGAVYLDRLRTCLAEAVEDLHFDAPPIRPVTAGEFAGAVGAASLAALQTRLPYSGI
jgi:predicted NBD/HSP70 family sugar kinase